MAAGMQLTLEEENCGVMVHLPVDFDVKSEDAMRRLGHTLTPVLVAHNLLHIRQAEPTAAPPSPKCIRAFYSALHAERYESVPFKPPGDAARTTQDENLRGRSFPGFNETQLLGRADHVEDLHGLSGPIWPRAWWEVAQSCSDPAATATATPATSAARASVQAGAPPQAPSRRTDY